MNLEELKRSLSKFPADLNDVEVLFTFTENSGKDTYESLAFVSYAEYGKDEKVCIILGSMSAALSRLKKGTLQYPDGSKPENDGYDISG